MSSLYLPRPYMAAVMAAVLHAIGALLGHEKFTTPIRSAHATPFFLDELATACFRAKRPDGRRPAVISGPLLGTALKVLLALALLPLHSCSHRSATARATSGMRTVPAVVPRAIADHVIAQFAKNATPTRHWTTPLRDMRVNRESP